MDINLIEKISEPKEDISLKNTKEIISALKKKMREFNASSNDKISFEKLKNLFILGASERCDDSIIISGFSRINMFLRLLKNKSFLAEFNKYRKFIPLQEDIATASEDIKNFKLDFEIKNLEELYFDNNEISFLETYL